MTYKLLEDLTDAELWKELRQLKRDADHAFLVSGDLTEYDKAKELIGEVEQEITRRDEL